jgi:predicted O-methyltransferase YrrM
MLAPYYLPTLLIADEIGLFAWLHETPGTTREVAGRYGMSAHAAEAMLGVLASKGHLVQHLGRFHLTESSRHFLLPDSVYYCGPALELRRHRPIDHRVLKEIFFRAPAEEAPVVFDTTMWQAGEAQIERHRASTASMHALFFPMAMALAACADLRDVHRMLDVAGGSGCFSIALAAQHPDLRLTVMELPAAGALAAEYVRRYDVADRVAIVTGDMFSDDWPVGHDAHLFSNVFHDWDHGRCQTLASKSFAALPTGGRIFLHESLLNETLDGPPLMALYSMNMARVTEYGKQYSAMELEGILAGAGFSDVRVRHTYSIFSLISARKG